MLDFFQKIQDTDRENQHVVFLKCNQRSPGRTAISVGVLLEGGVAGVALS